MRWLLVGWAWLWLCLGAATNARAEPSKAQRVVLNNGLEVLLQRDARVPRVAVAVTYRVGSGHDPKGYRGLAHFAEHITFRGSRHVKDRDALARYLGAGAIEANGVTSATDTVYHVNLPAEQLPLALWIESDRMGFVAGAIDPAAFKTEREVVLEELRENSGTSSEIYQLVNEAAYPAGHPYHEAANADDDVSSIEPDHVRWFLQTYYRPDNATLAIVGDIDVKATLSQVKRYFGPLRAAAVAKPTTGAAPVHYHGRRRLQLRAPWPRSELNLHWTLPCRTACRSVAIVLRGLLQRRLVSVFEHESSLASDAAVSLLERERHLELRVSLTLTLDADLEAARKRLLTEIAAFSAMSTDKSEFASARTAALVAETARWESLVDHALILSFRRDENQPERLASVRQSASGLRAVSAKQVHEAAARWLRPDRVFEWQLERTDSGGVRVENDNGDLQTDMGEQP